MAPRVKHFQKSTNNRRSLILFEKDSSKDSSNILQSLKSSNVKAQQEQVQKMRSDLQIRERKILQDISNLNNAPPPKPIRIPNVSTILPEDINERNSFPIPYEFPSFVASPIIFKETSFLYNHPNSEESFVFYDNIAVENINNPLQSIAKSSSPNKVPSKSNLLTSEPENFFEYETNKFEDITSVSSKNKSEQGFASPISEKSISAQPEIEFFTIDPDFLQSFEGIWRKKLDQPIRSVDPSSPDHFDRIPMISKGAKARNNQPIKK